MRTIHNRWENFETWCVGEMVDDEEGGHLWKELARGHAGEAKARHPDDASSREAWQDATTGLARKLSQRLQDANPLRVMDVHSSLLLTALDRVDYVGIAERLLGEFFDREGNAGDAPDFREPMMFETFTALRWATSDGSASDHWRAMARTCRDEAERMPTPNGVAPAAASLLAEALRDQLPEILAGGTSGVRDEFFDCALSRIDWWQLARELFRIFETFDVGRPETTRYG